MEDSTCVCKIGKPQFYKTLVKKGEGGDRKLWKIWMLPSTKGKTHGEGGGTKKLVQIVFQTCISDRGFYPVGYKLKFIQLSLRYFLHFFKNTSIKGSSQADSFSLLKSFFNLRWVYM